MKYVWGLGSGMVMCTAVSTFMSCGEMGLVLCMYGVLMTGAVW